MRFIGDVHGKFGRYKSLIREGPPTIQVGDMGVGFRNTKMMGDLGESDYAANPPHQAMVAGNHRFIRGNHDNPEVCSNHSQWIADGTVEHMPNGEKMMFIGGAVSIDREYRREGYSWWPNEELSAETFNQLVDLYDDVKPEIMVTHDCPESIAGRILSLLTLSSVKLDPRHASRSRQAFQAMLDMHMYKPRLWVFGHWHVSFDKVIDGTRFVCLAELECRDLD